jgi:hypothetical protein
MGVQRVMRLPTEQRMGLNASASMVTMNPRMTYAKVQFESKLLECSQKCVTCLASVDSCLSCSEKSFRKLNGTQCLCLEGYYDDGSNCEV